VTPPEGALQLAVGGVTTPRVVAAGICADLRAGEMLDSSFERRAVDLDARDRRWLRELMYGMLR
jgi:16S rRNA (cytosine967-C5)-methyltransferase